MKINLTPAVIAFSTILLTCCASKPEDMNVTDLETPCDYVVAYEKVLDDIILLENKEEDLSEDELNRSELLREKLSEIKEQAETQDISEKAARKCPNFKSVRKKFKKI